MNQGACGRVYGQVECINSRLVDENRVKVENPIDLVGAAIKKASGEEIVANIYAFESEGKKVIAAFDVLNSLSNDKPVFYYSILEKEKLGNFARYDYRNNSMDFSNSMGDHAYLYAKVINLTKPFPFLS